MAIYGTLGDIDVGNTDYPSIQPTLDLNFAKTKALDPRVTFYRSSLGTYVDDKGIIRTVPENVPRFDHDPTTGESLGLLIEESRTNLRTNSENFSVWGSGGDRITVSNNTVTAPDGNLTADSFIEQANTKTWRWIEWGQSCTSGTAYTVSCFVKPGTGTFGVIYFFPDNSVFTAAATSFDLSGNGSVSSLGSSTTAKITSYPNGWYRISATQTANNSSTGYFAIGFSYSSNFTIAPMGSPSNTVGYVWGAQVETGSFPTSYIPTTTSTVTRSADVCYIDGTNFSSWYSPNGGTAYIDIIPRGISNSLPYQVYFSFNSTSGDRWGISHQNGTSGSYPSNAVVPYVGTGGAFSSTLAGTFISGQRISVAMNQPNGTNIESSRDGASVQSVITSRNPAITNLLLGAQISDNSGLMGNIKRFMYYPKRLTNTQLQNLTA